MTEQEIKQLSEAVQTLEASFQLFKKNPPLATHGHTGFDMDKVDYTDLKNRTEHYYHTIAGTAAATGTNYGVFFIAHTRCYVSKFQEVHQTAGSDAGAVTLQLEKLTGTTAPDSGSTVLASALSLKATANTVQTATLTGTLTNRNLSAGDRLCLKDAGTLTAVANVTVHLEITIL